MGYTRWSSDMYDNLRKSYNNKSREKIFSSRGMSPDMSPYGVLCRESRDSAAHPESLAIQVYLDVTGSMGKIPEILVTKKLGSLMNTLIAYGIEHPQILFGAIGDQYADHYPLQTGQFESGTVELDQWLTKIYLEGGGGGQQKESYLLAWLFAARHTAADCFEKRGQKGFVFTIGDEWTWDKLSQEEVVLLTGTEQAKPVSAAQLLMETMRTNHVFHIHINEGSYRNASSVIEPWRSLMGENFIKLEDHSVVAETIASTVAILHGSALEQVTRSFDKKTAGTVAKALENIRRNKIYQNRGTIYLR